MLGCKGCTFGCAWTSGVRAGVREHTGGALERARARGCARWGVWLADVLTDRRLARERAAVSAGVRLRVRRRIFWLREGKLSSCIEEEEEASRAKGDSSWVARGSHDRRGETGKKLGSRLIAHSKLVVRIERRIIDIREDTDLMSPRLAFSVRNCQLSI
ncbi:hypothetical protein CRG98_020151 [Punica granatum]|uniref:Uncharacterized protein n=1 Tax=Punica granatum TaxID=22663 RepID=A0A2I0JT70_PUNGR|nr:hypothetical protein CRG98_020151 [Punica granatum]